MLVDFFLLSVVRFFFHSTFCFAILYRKKKKTRPSFMHRKKSNEIEGKNNLNPERSWIAVWHTKKKMSWPCSNRSTQGANQQSSNLRTLYDYTRWWTRSIARRCRRTDMNFFESSNFFYVGKRTVFRVFDGFSKISVNIIQWVNHIFSFFRLM